MSLCDLFCSCTSYQNNATPLYVATQIGHHDVVQTLLGACADRNIATSDVSYVTEKNHCGLEIARKPYK